MEGTRREQIISLLQQRSCSVWELTRQFQVPIKVIIDDLKHIEHSLKKSHRLKQSAPVCQSCDFIFTSRDKWQKPSRCPHCKSERILDGLISLVPK